MAKKFFTDSKDEISLSSAIKEFNKASEKTKETIINLQNEPSKERLDIVLDSIKKDNKLTIQDKEILTKNLFDSFLSLFNFDNCPNDYASLKHEAKFLAGITQYSFLLMAQRLLKIRNFELYKEDGYSDFKAFVENELTIGRTSVYNYIDIVSIFGVQALEHQADIKYSKLFPVIPLLKSEQKNIPKDHLKQKFLNEIKIKSFRDITEEAKELKIQYGLVKIENENDLNKAVKKFIKVIPSTLTVDDKLALRKLHDIINQLL